MLDRNLYRTAAVEIKLADGEGDCAMANNQQVAAPRQTATAWPAFIILLIGGLVLAMLFELLFVVPWNAMPTALAIPGMLAAPSLFVALAYGRARMLILWALIAAAVIALYALPWHPRKRFVWDLYSLQSGMTVTEVESVMGKYIKGPGRKFEEVGFGETVYPDDVSKATGTMIYRWNDTDWAYDADWGEVQFENGRVVRVQFLPD